MFEFLLILATPAPPPGPVWEQDSRTRHLSRGSFPSSAVTDRPEGDGGAPLAGSWARCLSSWEALTIVLLGGSGTAPCRPGLTQPISLPAIFAAPPPSGADFSAAGNNEWGWGEGSRSQLHHSIVTNFPSSPSEPASACTLSPEKPPGSCLPE